MKSLHGLRALLPAIILVTLVGVGLGASYYFTSARPNSVTVTWAANPLFIKFSSQAGSGSVSDSFTCSSSVTSVALLTRSNQPDIISLTVDPSGFSSCGSTPDNVVVTAACTPTAQANNTCLGDFSGKVTVCGPSPYTCLQRTLIVVINVANNNDNGNGQTNRPLSQLP